MIDLRHRHAVASYERRSELVLYFNEPPIRQQTLTLTTGKRATRSPTGPGILPPDIESPQESDAPPIGWYEASKLAAAAVVERERLPLRSLESMPRTIPKPERYEAGMFDRGPAHKVGTIDSFGEGVSRTWTTPYCYVISGMGPQGREFASRCQSSGAKYSADNAFGELKPKYLRPREEEESR
jgi:hypothetical protein